MSNNVYWKRIRQDVDIIKLTKNWREILVAKIRNRPLLSIRLRNGVVLNSPPEVDLNFLFHEIWMDEVYAPAGYQIRPNDVVIDIGANIGVFAMYAATRGNNIKVKSFEPFPKNAEFFRVNQKASRIENVEFYAQAVASKSGMRALHVHDSWMLHSLTDKDSGETGIEVDCVSLDHVVKNIVQCDLLKLDCEGGEYEILYSASKETLSKIMRIVCEFNVLDGEKKNGEVLGDFLLKSGFVVDTLKPLNETTGFICAKQRT